MSQDENPSPAALRALCQLAGDRAAGWRPETRPASAASAAAARHTRLLKVGLLGGLSVLTLAVVAAQFSGAFVSAGTPVPSHATAPAQRLPVPAFAAIDAAAGPAERVSWQDGDLVVDLDAVPLWRAVSSLARATRTTVVGDELLQQSTPVTLHRRYVDVAAAWRDLLQRHAAFSVACVAAACQLRISGDLTAPAAAAAPAADRTPHAPAPAPSELEISQPGGSC